MTKEELQNIQRGGDGLSAHSVNLSVCVSTMNLQLGAEAKPDSQTATFIHNLNPQKSLLLVYVGGLSREWLYESMKASFFLFLEALNWLKGSVTHPVW